MTHYDHREFQLHDEGVFDAALDFLDGFDATSAWMEVAAQPIKSTRATKYVHSSLRIRSELTSLRKEAELLERHLHQLEQDRDKDTTKLELARRGWMAVALEQRLQRLQAEAENTELRRSLGRHAQSFHELEALLSTPSRPQNGRLGLMLQLTDWCEKHIQTNASSSASPTLGSASPETIAQHLLDDDLMLWQIGL